MTVATEDVVELALDNLRLTAGGRDGTFIFEPGNIGPIVSSAVSEGHVDDKNQNSSRIRVVEPQNVTKTECRGPCVK